MLVRLHDHVFVNPNNVAVVICGDISICLRMSNGRAHNIECQRADSCPLRYRDIMKELRKYADFVEIDGTRSVNVDQIISLNTTSPGIVVNTVGEYTVYIATKDKRGRMAELVKRLEEFR